MKINKLVKIGERQEQKQIVIPAEYDNDGNVIAEEYTEIETVIIPIMQAQTVEMTEEEIAEMQNVSTEEIAEEPTQLDRIEAQVMYTALLTDTLIEEE